MSEQYKPGRDRIFADATAAVGSFKFDDRVAGVFEDMISRSVPGYQQILEMLPTLTRRFRLENHRYYDLGCSLGAGMLAMEQGLENTPASIIGVDNSAAMLNRARKNLQSASDRQFDYVEQDLRQTDIRQAAMVLMNFTLQFVPMDARDDVIRNIYHGLVPGGALVLSEKIKFDDAKTNQALIDVHHQYKADQGYSDLEISQKRDAIENVLIPETLEAHTCRLRNAGFSVITPWVQNLQFLSILAIR